jgi:hypothetical protein
MRATIVTFDVLVDVEGLLGVPITNDIATVERVPLVNSHCFITAQGALVVESVRASICQKVVPVTETNKVIFIAFYESRGSCNS